jgi:regulator of protease activity HflC (stomatin/prohibitin superfamily)
MPSAPTGAAARQALNADTLMTEQEQSPAYRALHAKNLIISQYRVRKTEELDVIQANSQAGTSTCCCVSTCGGCGLIKFFSVNCGCVRKGSHTNGEFLFYGEGVHVIQSPFVSVEANDTPLNSAQIVHGTKAIITVEQGFVGLANDRGQPVLLPPGMHQWNSTTLKFEKMIDLSTSVIRMGPYTLVTVDEGYAGVTSDNGEQKILPGGQAYMLTHRNWKFEKFITTKLQTNDVGPITVTTGDNVPLETVATVNWRIEDVTLAARMSANTMQHLPTAGGASDMSEFDISKLRSDVMRQITASLAAFVGTISYSEKGGHGQMAQMIEGTTKDAKPSDAKFSLEPEPEGDYNAGPKALFDRQQMMGSVEHANEITGKYGVRILSINLISAYPADKALLAALSQGAVATVAAEQTETKARGDAKALLANARAEADAKRILAEGDAIAEELRAEGSLKAAQKLESSEMAMMVQKMRAAGDALKEGNANSFFFGLGGAGDIPNGVLGPAMLAQSGKAGAREIAALS